MPTLARALVLTLALPASAQTVRINAPLPQPHVGAIQGYKTGASGTRVVFLGDQNQPGRLELWAAPLDGSAPAVVLNPPLGGQSVGRSYEVDSDASHAALLFGGIWIAPTDGSAPAMALTPPIPIEDTGNYSFPFSPDGLWIVYKPTLDVSWPLSSVPSDGSGPPIELWTGDDGAVGQFAISLDSQRVVLVGSSGVTQDLHSVPIDGSGPPVLLSGPELGDSDIRNFQLSPDGARVVYLGDQDAFGVFELYSAPIDGSASAVKISGPMTAGGDVSSTFLPFAITPDGARVVYLADQDVDEQFELYSTPIDGSAAPVKLSGTLAAGRDVRSQLLTPDGRHVLFTADRGADEVFELYLAPVTGGVAPTKVSGALVPGGVVDRYLVSADSRFAVYRADQAVDGFFELYATPIGKLRRAGAPRVTRLNPPLAPGGSIAFAFELTDDERVLYRASGLADGRSGSFLVPLRGGPSASTPADDVVPGGFGLYFGDASEDGGVGLFSVPLVAGGKPVRLSAEPPLGPVEGDVHAFRAMPDGASVVYLADQELDERFELYRAPTDGGATPTKLSGALVAGGDVGGYAFPSGGAFALAPDGTRVAYVADQDTDDRVELFAVPTDGSATPTKLSGDFGPVFGAQPGLRFGSDGARVVYRAFRSAAGILELFSAPADGSTGPEVLNGAMTADSDVEPDFALSADASRVVYRADEALLDKLELFSAPSDGSGPRVRLNPALAATRDVSAFQLEPSSQYVVYRADQAGDELYEVFRAPLAGGAAAVRMNTSLAPGRSVLDFAVAPDGANVVYLADQEVDERYELFAVPITGGVPVKLNGALVAGGDVGRFGRLGVLSPDGAHVAYVADQDTDEQYELYSAPLDGSTTAVKVSGPLVAGGDVLVSTTPGIQTLAIRADGRLVLYVASALVPGTFGLWVARMDGVGTPVELSAAAPGRSVDAFELDPAGFQALFLTHLPGNLEERELFRVVLAGGPCVALTDGPVNLREFSFAPDLRRALFRTDGGGDGIFELFSARLPRVPLQSR